MPMGLSLGMSLGQGGKRLGPEMFTNPNFDTTSVAEWTASTGGVAGVAPSGQLQVTNNGAGWFYRQFTTVIGATYVFSGNFITKAGGGRLFAGTAIGNSAYLSSAAVGVLAGSFVATTTTTFVSCGDLAGGAGVVNVYDSFSLKLLG